MFCCVDKPTLVIVDLSVYMHRLSDGLKILENSKEHYQGYLKAQMAWLLSCQYLEGLVDVANCHPVMAIDRKAADLTYWRSDYLRLPEVVARMPQRLSKDKKVLAQLQELLESPGYLAGEVEVVHRVQTLSESLVTHYKAGRKHPDPEFKKLKRNIYKLLNSSELAEIPRLSVVGYEADDVAASLVYLNRLNGSPWNVLLVTIDSDWLGMVGPDCGWFCQYGYYPRVRYKPEEVQAWATKRLRTRLLEPKDIWKAKQHQGDKSDNLPSGSPMEVIDLFNPPEGYRLWEQPTVRAKLDNILTGQDDRANSWCGKGGRARDYLRQVGVAPAIRPFDSDLDLMNT